jgi:tRNA threonylcarbamoyladenosine biosynthesis protein TsaB
MVPPDALAAWLPSGALLLAGDAAPRLAAALSRRDVALADAPGIPDAVAVARLAAREWRPGDRPPPPRPLYLRAPDTTMPRPPARAS